MNNDLMRAVDAAWDHITEGHGSLPVGFDSWLDYPDVAAMVAAAIEAYDNPASGCNVCDGTGDGCREDPLNPGWWLCSRGPRRLTDHTIHWYRPIHPHGNHRRWAQNFRIYSGGVTEIADRVMSRMRADGHAVAAMGGDYTGPNGSPRELWFDVTVTRGDGEPPLRWEHAVVAAEPGLSA